MFKRLVFFFYVVLISVLFLNQISFACSTISSNDISESASWLAQAKQADSETTQSANLPASWRDPGTAIALATFPGIVIQGSGHFYAGRPITGALLLLVEAGAAYMTYRGAVDVWTVVDENFNDELTDIEVIDNLSDTSRISRGLGMAVGGIVLFLSSWLYDITGAPIAAEEENQKELKKSAPGGINARLTLRGFELQLNL